MKNYFTVFNPNYIISCSNTVYTVFIQYTWGTFRRADILNKNMAKYSNLGGGSSSETKLLSLAPQEKEVFDPIHSLVTFKKLVGGARGPLISRL